MLPEDHGRSRIQDHFQPQKSSYFSRLRLLLHPKREARCNVSQDEHTLWWKNQGLLFGTSEEVKNNGYDCIVPDHVTFFQIRLRNDKTPQWQQKVTRVSIIWFRPEVFCKFSNCDNCELVASEKTAHPRTGPLEDLGGFMGVRRRAEGTKAHTWILKISAKKTLFS